jgi:hypothetical protein
MPVVTRSCSWSPKIGRETALATSRSQEEEGALRALLLSLIASQLIPGATRPPPPSGSGSQSL